MSDKKRKRFEVEGVQASDHGRRQKTRVLESRSTDGPASEKSKARLRQEKSERRSKKSKSKPKTTEEPAAVPGEIEVEHEDAIPVVASAPTPADEKQEATPASTKTSSTRKPKPNKPSKDRFILFIGNLPYTATDTQIQAHFAKLQPSAVRHRVDKQTGRSKGFAFLEFDHYDKMKTCIKLYHHSIFDSERQVKEKKEENEQEDAMAGMSEERKKMMKLSQFEKNGYGRTEREKETGRRINVELTAGGGGNKENRKEKIKGKNKKLEEQRERAFEKERKTAEEEKVNRRGREGAATASGANAEIKTDEPPRINRDVHPSRRTRVK